MAQGLHTGEVQGCRRLKLAARNSRHRGTERLRHVRAGVQAHRDDRGTPHVQGDTDLRQAVKDDEQLNQQRGATENPNVHPRQPVHRCEAARARASRHNAHQQRHRERNQRQRDSHCQGRAQQLGQGLSPKIQVAFHERNSAPLESISSSVRGLRPRTSGKSP